MLPPLFCRALSQAGKLIHIHRVVLISIDLKSNEFFLNDLLYHNPPDIYKDLFLESLLHSQWFSLDWVSNKVYHFSLFERSPILGQCIKLNWRSYLDDTTPKMLPDIQEASDIMYCQTSLNNIAVLPEGCNRRFLTVIDFVLATRLPGDIKAFLLYAFTSLNETGKLIATSCTE